MYEKTGVKSLFKIYNDLRQTHFILDVFPLKLWELKKKKLKANLIQLSIWETLWTDVLRNEQSFIDAFWNWSRNHIDSFSNWKETEVEINLQLSVTVILRFCFYHSYIFTVWNLTFSHLPHSVWNLRVHLICQVIAIYFR